MTVLDRVEAHIKESEEYISDSRGDLEKWIVLMRDQLSTLLAAAKTTIDAADVMCQGDTLNTSVLEKAVAMVEANLDLS